MRKSHFQQVSYFFEFIRWIAFRIMTQRCYFQGYSFHRSLIAFGFHSGKRMRWKGNQRFRRSYLSEQLLLDLHRMQYGRRKLLMVSSYLYRWCARISCAITLSCWLPHVSFWESPLVVHRRWFQLTCPELAPAVKRGGIGTMFNWWSVAILLLLLSALSALTLVTALDVQDWPLYHVWCSLVVSHCQSHRYLVPWGQEDEALAILTKLQNNSEAIRMNWLTLSCKLQWLTVVSRIVWFDVVGLSCMQVGNLNRIMGCNTVLAFNNLYWCWFGVSTFDCPHWGGVTFNIVVTWRVTAWRWWTSWPIRRCWFGCLGMGISLFIMSFSAALLRLIWLTNYICAVRWRLSLSSQLGDQLCRWWSVSHSGEHSWFG